MPKKISTREKKELELTTPFSTRQYMIQQEFELYYYHDQVLPPVPSHSHEYYEIYFFLEGNVSICIQGQEHPLTPGDFMVIPPGIFHYPVMRDQEKPYRRFVLWISRSYCDHLLSASSAYGYLFQHVATKHDYIFHNDTISANTIWSLIFRIIDEVKGNRFGRDASISLQLNTLLLQLNRNVYDQNHTRSRKEHASVYESILEFVEEHLSEDLSLDRLEKQFYVNRYYLSHTFKDHMGVSLHQYITKKRLHACLDALVADMPLNDLLEQYGFGDYSSFYRAFRREYGMSPKDYRKQYQI